MCNLIGASLLLLFSFTILAIMVGLSQYLNIDMKPYLLQMYVREQSFPDETEWYDESALSAYLQKIDWTSVEKVMVYRQYRIGGKKSKRLGKVLIREVLPGKMNDVNLAYDER